MPTSATLRRACAAAALLTLTVAGCTSQSEPPGAPATSDSASSADSAGAASGSPTPGEPTTEAAATPSEIEEDLSDFTIPDCETLLPIETVRSEFMDGTEYYDLDAGVPLSERMPSEEANAAMAQAAASEDCLWGLPESDVGFTIDVAIIPGSARDSLIDSLLAGGEFSEAPLGAARSFVHALDGDSGLWVTLYAFEGNAWITYLGMGRTGTAAAITDSALANLQAANPGL